MKTRQLLIGAFGLFFLLVAGIFAFRQWANQERTGPREEMLSLLPADPSAVVFLDLQQFRKSSFLPQLLAWVPHDSLDEDYAQFVKATGFNYERDLDRVGIAFTRQVTSSTTYAIAEGRFDRKKIEEYAKRSGQSLHEKELLIFSINLKNSARSSYFTFLRDDRIAWTDDPNYAALFLASRGFSGKREWREHFARLAGSAVFAVVRQDPAVVEALAQQAPGRFRSPQLATLLSELQWVTIGGKPDENNLRVVIEGESAADTTLNQLKEFLQGIVLLAQVGLNGPENRKQMDPQLREAYLELLRSADVEKVDRGTEKSVRLVFEVTPGFLDAVKKSNISGAPDAH